MAKKVTPSKDQKIAKVDDENTLNNNSTEHVNSIFNFD